MLGDKDQGYFVREAKGMLSGLFKLAAVCFAAGVLFGVKFL